MSGEPAASARPRIGALERRQRDQLLRGPGLVWDLGGLTVALTTRLPDLSAWIGEAYGHHPRLDPATTVVDVPVRVTAETGPRRLLGRRAHLRIDGTTPLQPFPAGKAPLFFEWGLNWAIAERAHWYLMIHAATVARNGRGLILPGQPGTGKSTLAAGLVRSGWQLLSDEFALLGLSDGLLYPLRRPISLKGDALALFRAVAPARMSAGCYDSEKGKIGFYIPDSTRGDYASAPVRPAAIVVLDRDPEAHIDVARIAGADAFVHATRNSFNYTSLGEPGFRAMRDLVGACGRFYLRYPDVEAATAPLDDLLSQSEAA